MTEADKRIAQIEAEIRRSGFVWNGDSLWLLRHAQELTQQLADSLAAEAMLRTRAEKIDTLFSAIEHGDTEHWVWLKNKLEEHFSHES